MLSKPTTKVSNSPFMPRQRLSTSISPHSLQSIAAEQFIYQAEDQTSVTSTIFAGARLWTGASIFMNPELGGGSGLSGALGVAASTNGETYRIGNPKPRISLARIFYRQLFDLDDKEEYQESDQNQLAGMTPKNYFGIIIGKISLSDYFDDNKYSHDPRTQFMSWGLMNNGAWDFPANTIGYTPSILLEWVKNKEELRYAFSLVSEIANGMQMNWQINKANSNNLEYTHHYHIGKQQGAIRLLCYLNIAPMGNYEQAIKLSSSTDPPIGFNGANNALNVNGHTKYGFCLNVEQDITDNLGCFFRAGWNDGRNESWEFTEIDRTASVGISSTGSKWKRKDDNVGLAYVVSGLSAPHREYLKDGGMGFILGDGNLNYGLEKSCGGVLFICFK